MQSNKCEFHACERIQATSEGMSRFRVWHTYWRCFSFNACDYAAIRQKYSMPTWDGMCAFKFCSKCTRSCYCKTTLAQKEMREAKNSICRRGGQKNWCTFESLWRVHHLLHQFTAERACSLIRNFRYVHSDIWKFAFQWSAQQEWRKSTSTWKN